MTKDHQQRTHREHGEISCMEERTSKCERKDSGNEHNVEGDGGGTGNHNVVMWPRSRKWQ